MVRRILAAAWVALMVCALPALATVRDARVKFRIPDTSHELMRPGQSWTGDVQVIAPKGADIADFEFSGDGWDVMPMRTGEQRAALAAGGTITLRLNILRANPSSPLTVLYSDGGEMIQQRVNLRGLTREHPRTLPLRRLTDAEAALVPNVPNAASLARPEVPFRRVSRDAEGFVRGAVGDSVIAEPQRRSPLDQTGAQSTQARNIRVHGRIVGQGPQGNFGADGVYFAVYDEDTGFDELLKEGTTDANGNFDVTFNWDPCGLCDGQPDLYVYFETENSHVYTQSPVLEWEYSWETGVNADFTGTDLNIGAFMPGDTESDGVLYVHTAITRMWRWFNSLGWNLPTVDVQCWDDDADPVSYYTSIGEIHMSAARMFNTSSISHEYHHHWMETFSSNPAPDYCNGNCDNGSCGHCKWCQEKGSVVWSEGMPEFGERMAYNMFVSQYPGFTKDLRDVETVDSCTTAIDDGNKTEGLFAAAVYDLVDAANENDPVVPGASSDVLTLSSLLPYQIMDEVTPTTVAAFFNEVSNRNPGQKKAIWSTAMNGGVNLDTAAPSAVTGLVSTDHTVNVLSGDATIAMKWNEAADDWSGAQFYSISFTAAPALPDTFAETSTLSAVSSYLAPGTYYANVRAKDRFGRWSGTYASAGPYLLKTPDPADLTATQLAGWTRAVVPSSSSSNTVGNVNPGTLLFSTGLTYWNAAGINNGQSNTGAFKIVALLDGDSVDVATINSSTAGGTYNVINQAQVAVRGGRHTFGAFYDGGEVVAETNELNNTWARQWSWSPFYLNQNQLYDRTPAPGRTAGQEDIPAGETIYNNCDGLGFYNQQPWSAIWVYAADPDDDTDVRLHFDGSSVDTTYTRIVLSSARTGGYLDAIFLNHAHIASGWWNAGVVNWNGGPSHYRTKHVTSTPFTFGDSASFSFPVNEMMTLHEVAVPLGSLGDVVVTLRTTPGEVAHVQWLDDSYKWGTIGTYAATAVTDSNGLARFVINVNAAATYGVMCYRDPKDGSGALPFTLQIERAPADLATFTPAGWYSPVVPRPATDGTFPSVPMPDTLNSTPLPTYFNMGAKNIGTIAAPPTSSWMMVDGVLAATYGYPTWNANQQMLFNSTYAVYIRGGRHTLSHILDGQDLVEELVTSNNQYGEQYVWAPLPLTADVASTRLAPPDRTAGWTEVTNAATLYFNSDGLRMPNVAPSGTANHWSAVAVMPSAASDVDLRLHEAAKGTKTGFTNPLTSSVWGSGLSDFVLANFHSTPYRTLDVGAIRYSGTDPYTVMATTSQRRTIPVNGVLGTFTQGANDLLDLHEVWLEPGAWGVTLEPLSGTANLGFSVHDTTRFQGKSTNVAHSWQGAANEVETASVSVTTAGWYCIAVWKTATVDVGQSATYRLVLSNASLDASDTAPKRASFGSPWPNPATGPTSVQFALPSAGPVSLEVYDVSGARVRTLVRGERGAGQYTVSWDGRGDEGRRMPAGLYYLRFHGGGLSETRKIVRVE